MEHRERAFRCEAFKYPLVEYIATRTEKAIRRCLGEEMLSKPEEISAFQNISELIRWPGVSNGVIKDLAVGLSEAGYESFELRYIKKPSLAPKRKAVKTEADGFGVLED